MMRFILPSNRKSRQGRRSFRPALDALEGRQLLSTIPLFSVTDNGVEAATRPLSTSIFTMHEAIGNSSTYSQSAAYLEVGSWGQSGWTPTDRYILNDQIPNFASGTGPFNLIDAVSIDSNGVIRADALKSDGTIHDVTLTPIKPTPTIHWSPPASIVVGSPLSASMFDNAYVTMPPLTFAGLNMPNSGPYKITPPDGSYTNPQNVTFTVEGRNGPVVGTALTAGTYTIDAMYNPYNSNEYEVAVSKFSLTVQQTPIVTWYPPAPITYGTPLGTTQLDAHTNIAGTYSYTLADGKTPAANAVLHAGAAQTLNVTFTPDDLVDYTTVTQTTTLDVLRAPMTVTANNASVMYGQPIPALTGTVAGLVNGDSGTFVFPAPATQGDPPGRYAIISNPPFVPGFNYGDYTVKITTGVLTISNPVIAGLTLNSYGDLQIIGQLSSGNVVSIAPMALGSSWVQVTDNGVSAAFAASSVHYIHYLGSLSGYDTFRTSFVPDGYTYAQVYGRNNLIANQTTSGLAYWSINGEFNMLVTMGTTNAINDVMTTGPRYTDAFYGSVVFLN